MKEQEAYETIEAYINGSLTGKEKIAFEARIQSDQDLENQVALFQEMDEAIGDTVLLDFQKLVQREGEAFQQNNTTAIPSTAKVRRIGGGRRYLAIAASVLVLAVSTFMIWKMQSGTSASGKELFAQNFETYSLNQDLRGENPSADSLLSIGIQQYQANDFTGASRHFKTLVANDEKNMVLTFCLANAYLNQQPAQFLLAEQQFQKIITDGESIYVPRAKWYLALILLEKENRKDAKVLLKEVATAKDSFGRKATELLQELK